MSEGAGRHCLRRGAHIAAINAHDPVVFRSCNQTPLRRLSNGRSVEVICDGGGLAYLLNAVPVKGVKDSPFREGRILFQSEVAEGFFRGIELHALKK